MGVVGGMQKCIFCCTFCICAYLSALLSLNSFSIFFVKISWLSGVVGGWLWCYHFMAGVHCFADIDQVDLLCGGEELLG